VYGYQQVNVAAQEDDPDSYLNLTRFLIQTRQSQPALKTGEMEWVETEYKGVLAFRRYVDDDEGVLCVFNLTNQPQTFTLKRERLNLLAKSNPNESGTFTLAAYAVYWFQS
jgi:maltose alpha-D-glucosyltransferase/alpha-amylase